MNHLEPKLMKTLPANSSTEIHLANYIRHSTLKIHCPKEFPMELTQYIICKCFIIEFDLLLLSTINKQDCYLYTGKEIRFCREPDLLTEENVKEIYDGCDEFRTLNFLEFLDNVTFKDGEFFYTE